MSKSNIIKWRNKDNVEIVKTVKNFNAKIRRLEKNPFYKDIVLPDRLSVRDLKNQIVTRNDYNYRVEQLKEFSKNRYSQKPVEMDNGLTITKWELKTVKENFPKAENTKRKMSERLKNINVKSLGKDLGYKREQMGDIEQKQYESKDINKELKKKRNADEWKHFVKNIENKITENYSTFKDNQAKNNFIKLLNENFGSKANGLVKKLKSMNPSDFYIMYKENPELDFKFLYEDDEETANETLERYNEIVDDYV